MRIIDAHCDLLGRMLVDSTVSFVTEHPDTRVNRQRMQEANYAFQIFALYLSESLRRPGFPEVLEMVDLFRERVCREGDVILVRSVSDLQKAAEKGQLGGLLSLEGAEGLGGSLTCLRTLHELGLRLLGLTWNHANWAADGVGESRNGGFTEKGKGLVRECNRLGIIMDVSHLAERGFWELADLSDKPFIASHSNAKALCPHRRNLTDDQITALIERQGRIGITFVPWFLSEGKASLKDILKHIDYIGSRGGMPYLGFGSDFDGFDGGIPGLEHPGCFPNLVNELQKHYKEDEVRGLLFDNWYKFLQDNLPQV
ncbi:dipeptidase [Paenibacillus aurantius]|uniref:Dipeptidase n=1 Tax=Paenibacillus aurantius TaxID=2918900 RepID=A0AA96LIV1_9BACL|nr:dipeptidase [Paenibacillus aurantius]WNQ13803.1 dipeptidase [Paenibacillus aurantius]